MGEVWALSRMTWYRVRFGWTVVMLLMVLGIVIAMPLKTIFPGAALFVLLVGFIPAAIWSLLIFDADFQDAVEGIETGYNRWLLKLPIATWKLAIVPAVWRATMVGGVCIAFSITLSNLTNSSGPIVIPAIGFASASVWLAALGWRPFGRVLIRSIVGISTLAVVTAWAFFLIWADFELWQGQWYSRALLMLAASVALLSAFLFSIRCLKLARHNPDGLLPASATTWPDWPLLRVLSKNEISKQRDFRKPLSALAWHDWTSVPDGTKIILLLFSLALLPFALWIPLHAGVFAALMFSLVFCYSQTTLALLSPQKDGHVLPTYLSASPLRNHEIAWWRVIAITQKFGWCVGVLIAVSLIWFLRASRQDAWQIWTIQVADQFDTSWAATRIVAASAILFLIATLGRAWSGLWSAMMGRPRVHLYAMLASASWVMAPIFLFPPWMLHQVDYESAIANAWWWAGWLPALGWAWAAVKVAGVVGASYTVIRGRFANGSQVMKIICGWTVFVAAMVALVSYLNPHPSIRLEWVALLVVFLIPLARLIILPYSVSLDRHR